MKDKKSLVHTIRDILTEGLKVSANLFKIMIPIIIGVKILKETGVIKYLAQPLAPLMGLVGLPGDMGLVWAAAMFNNMYAGIVVFARLAPDVPMTVAQVTVLCFMLLVAHNMLVEIRIAQKAGCRAAFQVFLRFGGALLGGALLSAFYRATGWLNEKNVLLWTPEEDTKNLLQWAMGEAVSLFYIFLIIVFLISIMRLMAWLRLTELCTRALHPFLRVMGIGREASLSAVIGMVMGLAYGGGLIISEAKSGKIEPMDVFYSLSLLGLCHSIIEDTLLMLMLGGHMSGILWGRMVFSLGVIGILARMTRNASPALRKKLFVY